MIRVALTLVAVVNFTGTGQSQHFEPREFTKVGACERAYHKYSLCAV